MDFEKEAQLSFMESSPQINLLGNKPKNLYLGWFIFFVILGFISSFLSGFLIKGVVDSVSPVPTTTPAPIVTTVPNPEVPFGTEFLPGKSYFSDTLIAVSKDGVSFAIAATVSRAEKETTKFAQTTKISLFNGSEWKRSSQDQTTTSSTISSNTKLKNWAVNLDPSRVLRQNVEIDLNAENHSIQISANNLQNEVLIRSLPGYTKLMSSSEGQVVIDGETIDVYLLYTQIFSLNSSEIQFYDRQLGVTTYWIAFWDAEGNFYHIDATDVQNQIDKYKSHKIGVKVSPEKAVVRSFDVSVVSDTAIDPQNIAAEIGTPIFENLNISRLNLNNKAPNTSYNWIMGTVTGEVSNRSGVGLFEYIKD